MNLIFKSVLTAKVISLLLFAPLGVMLAVFHAAAESWWLAGAAELICGVVTAFLVADRLGDEEKERKENTRRLLRESGL